MNPTDPLLDTLLADPAALDAMRAAALRTLRRRRAARYLATCAAAAALIVCAVHLAPHRGVEKIVVPPPLAEAPAAPPSHDLTDDELLSHFPPGTCTLAAVDGRKMLVFLTDEGQAKYQR